MKKIEYILKMIPLFSFLLIVAGSVKLAVYYNFFRINIVDYLSISEYIPLFLDDLHSLLYSSIVFVSAFFFGSTTKKKEKGKKENEEKTLKFISIAIIILAGIVFPLIIYYTNNSIYEILENFGSLFFMFMCGIALLYLSQRKKISLKHFSGWLFFLLIIPIVMSGYRDAHQIIENKTDVQYEVSIKGKTLDKNNLFLGKSDKHIFFYNLDKRKSIIYPMNNVDEINIIFLD